MGRMWDRPDRSVVALVSTPGGFTGRTGVIPVGTPDWNHVEPVNTALRALLDVETSVLRLLSTEGGKVPFGGVVTYHVEAHDEPDHDLLEPAEAPAPDAEHRLPWARPGGPSELVAWADSVITRTGPAAQVRTWNLSSVHRLPTANGPVWLKAVPPFFADEGSVIKMVAAHDPALVPEVLAWAPGRVLMSQAEGTKCWPVTAGHVEEVVPRWVAVQHALAGEPQLRPSAVPMPDFGLPDTLTHGDFHPGNWLDSGVVIDWSDAVWGHPALDACRLMEYAQPELHDLIRRVWSEAWLRHRPDSEPLKALEIAPRASRLHNAVKYQEFLDNIEESERIYHEGDPQIELREALRLVSG
ncbi:Phosphotransferase enzyme family protein [Lentzea albida]|uniref:Phosphotransferase enzyme family protein n=2 Tax=Lentzea albida TaxID=65499 RepID=A0A1H9SX72_9PSEU|nr:Phosphotransferase enzyme family protein [Lentzea albida]